MSANSLYILIIIGLIIVSLLVLAVLLIFNVSRRRILAQISDKQKKELEFQQQMLNNSIETQEKERSRIAKELHDDIGSKLNIVNLNLNLLDNAITNDDSMVGPMDQIRTSLKDSIVRIRELSHVLYPPILEKFGLQSALSSLAISVNRTGQIALDLDIGEDWKEMTNSQELNIYRIIQELITNTLKHAKAKNIVIQSEVKDNLLTLIYRDDGVGIDNELLYSNGMGMMNIKTRAALLVAKVELSKTSKTKKGMEMKIFIPLAISPE